MSDGGVTTRGACGYGGVVLGACFDDVSKRTCRAIPLCIHGPVGVGPLRQLGSYRGAAMFNGGLGSDSSSGSDTSSTGYEKERIVVL